MEEVKKIYKKNQVTVATKNDMITAIGLADLSLNAKKLLYIAMAQCKIGDEIFYEYKTTPAELADMWGISRQAVYQMADSVTTELMRVIIDDRTNGFDKMHLFSRCTYRADDKTIYFKISEEMKDVLLNLGGDYSRPLMWDFMKMKSTYSMAVWHVMQREMKSFKPMASKAPMVFDISLADLRKASGTENKFKQVGQFKQNVLDKAIKEIKQNLLVDITYENIKQSRTITGFRFTAKNALLGDRDVNSLSLRSRKKIRKAELVYKAAKKTITKEESAELIDLTIELDQYNLEDYENGTLT